MEFGIAIAGLVVINLLVSSCVLRDRQRNRREKITEMFMIWCLPIFGALMSVCVFCRDPEREKQVEEIEKDLHSPR